MLAQASEFAVLAAISPTALLVIAVYLGSARPRRTGAYYLAGAVLMSLRLGLGILALAAGAFVVTRKPKPPDPDKPDKGIVSRMIANPSPGTDRVRCRSPGVHPVHNVHGRSTG
ncbi:MAG TPA: hypothetical protein VE864_13680, partial [Streptosporangiaceae bacterium]|nr:hypothetical protein [Streptosporangiaceae bacterium]